MRKLSLGQKKGVQDLQSDAVHLESEVEIVSQRSYLESDVV